MKKICLILLVACLAMSGCGSDSQKTESVELSAQYYAYYLNTDSSSLAREPVDDEIFQSSDKSELVDFLTQLMKTPADSRLIPVLGNEIDIIKYEIDNQQLILHFPGEYANLPPDVEILMRAAVVRTYEQIDGVDKISFMVDGSPLTDASGGVIGPMDKSQFVENMGTDINAYKEDTLYLYFADNDYKKLVKTSLRVMRRTSISRERVVLDYLLQGPIKELSGSVSATVPGNIKINSIITKNGICYIDFSERMASNDANMIDAKLMLYSIVNSVTEDSNIFKVKFSIDSNEAVKYRGINLEEAFEADYSIVE